MMRSGFAVPMAFGVGVICGLSVFVGWKAEPPECPPLPPPPECPACPACPVAGPAGGLAGEEVEAAEDEEKETAEDPAETEGHRATSRLEGATEAAKETAEDPAETEVHRATSRLEGATKAADEPVQAVEGGARVYDFLYDKQNYHNNLDFSQEGPVVELALKFLPPAGPCRLGASLCAPQRAGSLAAALAGASAAAPLRLLVVGCSHGKGAGALARGGFDASGTDVAHKAVEMASSARGRTCRAPPCFRQAALGQTLPWPAAAFDLAVSSDVFEHVPTKDVPAAAAEVSRLVKHVLVLRIANFPEYAKEGERLGMGNLHVTTKPSSWWVQQFAPHGWGLICDLPQRPDIWRDPFVFIVLGRVSAGVTPASAAEPCRAIGQWWRQWRQHAW